MLALRWILGLTIGFLGGGYLFLFLVSNGFRSSFGGSKNNPLLAILPLLAAGLLLASVIFPAQKTLLHLAAVAAVGIVGFCVWQMISESAVVVWFGIIYVGVWFIFYWHAAWR
jgi:hypothetical protein